MYVRTYVCIYGMYMYVLLCVHICVCGYAFVRMHTANALDKLSNSTHT